MDGNKEFAEVLIVTNAKRISSSILKATIPVGQWAKYLNFTTTFYELNKGCCRVGQKQATPCHEKTGKPSLPQERGNLPEVPGAEGAHHIN